MREAILRTAAQLYTHFGYEGTTIRDIATAQGLLPGSIYHHFGSKDALIIELYTEAIEHIMSVVAHAADGVSDPWERLAAACTAHLSMLANRHPYAGVLSRDIPMTSPVLTKTLLGLRDRYEKAFAQYVDALGFATPLEARIFRLQLLGSLNAALRWYRKRGKLKPHEIARLFVNNMVRP
ncbi:MAG: TetR/AcrR family transcriptional regulator [Roseiarcus sp.]